MNLIFKVKTVILAAIITLSAGEVFSQDYEVGFTSPLNKVFFEYPHEFDGEITNSAEISLAKNEYEAIQLVIFPSEDINNFSVYRHFQIWVGLYGILR